MIRRLLAWYRKWRNPVRMTPAEAMHIQNAQYRKLLDEMGGLPAVMRGPGASARIEVENKELRRYIAMLLEPKRNRSMQRPDQMVKTFFAFNDREKAEFFNRMALRIGIDRDVSISPPFPYRRHSWPAIMPFLHMDAVFHFGKVVLPLIGREWDTLSMVDHRIKPQRLDDSTVEIVRRWK